MFGESGPDGVVNLTPLGRSEGVEVLSLPSPLLPVLKNAEALHARIRRSLSLEIRSFGSFLSGKLGAEFLKSLGSGVTQWSDRH